MTDSPSRHRSLARTDSTRFFPSRGAIGFTYGFTFASILFTLFLVNAFHPSRRNHFSKVFAHILSNSSFSPSPTSYTPHTTNDTTTTTPSKTSHLNKDGELHDNRFVNAHPPYQISRKEGSGLITPPKHSNNKDESFAPMPSPNTKVDSQNVMQSDQHLVELRKTCDMFEGSWVLDDSYPLYKSGSCPHIDESFNCFLNGRKDNMYEKFRWQPKNCNMPRYNFMMIFC